MENQSLSDIESIDTPKKGLTRRQVAVGAAWAVPVVALAVGAPAQAASNPLNHLPDSTSSTTKASQSPSDPQFGEVFNAEFESKGQTSFKTGFLVVMTTAVGQTLTSVSADAPLIAVGAQPVVAGGLQTWTWQVSTGAQDLNVYAAAATTAPISVRLYNLSSIVIGNGTITPHA